MTRGLIGETARVTARISGQQCGEVLVSVGQGTEAYFAFSYEPSDEFEVGMQVVVVDESPGRTLYVSGR